ncbi:hypothetical protein RND71_023575 [Anisodus tanguticus]|uniref:O-fucosyltransferase family protein n=1 Tax=Anisodus tanguticus TaxID=243964 RepID=A0AAE1RTC8_9SOLA|nr:hypothetical protein RND71_023575 [Anisodus tanguticus]
MNEVLNCPTNELLIEELIGQLNFPSGEYNSNGYLMISTNGGLNQMRAGVLPLMKKHEENFTKSDFRLANNELPIQVQKLRCLVNYDAMRFVPPIMKLDSISWWKNKHPNSTAERLAGSCPLTLEETALILKALNIYPNTQIYIDAGDTYGGDRRLASLREAFPNLPNKKLLVKLIDTYRRGALSWEEFSILVKKSLGLKKVIEEDKRGDKGYWVYDEVTKVFIDFNSIPKLEKVTLLEAERIDKTKLAEILATIFEEKSQICLVSSVEVNIIASGPLGYSPSAHHVAQCSFSNLSLNHPPVVSTGTTFSDREATTSLIPTPQPEGLSLQLTPHHIIPTQGQRSLYVQIIAMALFVFITIKILKFTYTMSPHGR